MAQVLVRNLDERVVDQLKARAKENGRSLQAELKRILEDAAQAPTRRMTMAESRALADRIRAMFSNRVQSDSGELHAEDRAR
jgi:antitoxin FitA